MAQGELIAGEDVRVGGPAGAPGSRLDLSKRFRDLKREVVEAFEREYTEELLRAHDGNIAAAARHAGLDRKNLWALAKKYDIDIESFRRGRG